MGRCDSCGKKKDCFHRPCCGSTRCYDCLEIIAEAPISLAENYECPNGCEDGSAIHVLTALSTKEGRTIYRFPLQEILNDLRMNYDELQEAEDAESESESESESDSEENMEVDDQDDEHAANVENEEIVDERLVEEDEAPTKADRIYGLLTKPNAVVYPRWYSQRDKRNPDRAKLLVETYCPQIQEASGSRANGVLLQSDLSAMSISDLTCAFRQSAESIDDMHIVCKLNRRDMGYSARELRRRKLTVPEIVVLLGKKSTIYNAINWYRLLRNHPECIFLNQNWSTIAKYLTGKDSISCFDEAFEKYESTYGVKFGQLVA